jgi:pantoate--beta-alanine ligase
MGLKPGDNMARKQGIAIVNTVRALRAQVEIWKRAGERVALVPTMGALHAGHISLVKAAQKRRAKVITSIFVNPTQFAPTEDFSKYPRTFESDCAMLTEAGCDLVYAPAAAEIYPDGFSTGVIPAGPAKAGLEDSFRPTHFEGVATVVAKLFGQCRPDIALFGEKDYQQLQVITRMATDLDLGVNVIGAPTIREKDGLAMSSRNRYLSSVERDKAALIPLALKTAIKAIRTGVSIDQAVQQAKTVLTDAGYEVDYVAVRDAGSLQPIENGSVDKLGDRSLRILVAAKIGKTRLIDNMAV